jgi:transposase
MPWLETSPVEQRERFIRDHRAGLYMMTELCARYDVSPKTGYKWLERFDEAGRRGLQEIASVLVGDRQRITVDSVVRKAR